MGEELRVAVIDDDAWKRHAMSVMLDRDPRVRVVYSLDQDEAAEWDIERWKEISTAVVDVHDDRAPGELGTDIYSGIKAIENLSRTRVDVVALMPFDPHPLVQYRLFLARPSRVYKRWELQDSNGLIAAMNDRDPLRRCEPPSAAVLTRYGVRPPDSLGRHRSNPNRAVDAYLASGVSGLISPQVGIKAMGASVHEVRRIRTAIAATGFEGTEARSLARDANPLPRWPDVRDYLLRLLGRFDAPASDHDKPWLYN